MKTNKLLLTALALSGLTVLGASTFADYQTTDSTTSNSSKGYMRQGKMMQGQGMNKGARSGMIGVMRFVDLDSLTDDQKTSFTSLQEAHKQEMQLFLEKMKAATDDQKDSLKQEATALREKHTSQLRDYVSEDKLSEFDEFVSNTQNYIGKGMMGEGQIRTIKGEGKMGQGMRQSRFIKGALAETVKTKLLLLSQSQLEALVVKIDAALEKVDSMGIDENKKQMYVGIYSELKTIIDSLNIDDEAQSIIDELF